VIGRAAPSAYRRLVFPLAARLDAERAHDLAVGALARLSRSPAACALLARLLARAYPLLAVERLGLRFRGPLGLAAGFDKNAVAVPALGALGFGHLEVGTVTPRPQPGNPRPRLFRLPVDEALLNALGFPSQGAAAVAANLRRWQARRAAPELRGVPVAVNLGKNRDTPLARAWADYADALAALYSAGDYFVVNISSPNTAGLRELHAADALAELGAALAERRAALAAAGGGVKPLLLKLSPDLTAAQRAAVVAVAREGPWAGLVVGNTTVQREGLRSPCSGLPGGLSGRPLFARTLAAIAELRPEIPSHWVVIAVGGVFDAEGVWRLLLAGADLVQAYTGFVYEGPLFAARIHAELARRVAVLGATALDEALGGLRPVRQADASLAAVP
jgi:dihydroorotate dehydrogenase